MRAFGAPCSRFASTLRQQRHLYTAAHTRWPSSQKAPPTPFYERINGNRDGINQSLLPITADVAFPTERSFESLLNGSATVRLQETHLEKMRSGDGDAFEHMDSDVETQRPETLKDHNAFPVERSFTSLRDGSATVQLQKAYLAEKRRREGPDVARGGFTRMDRDGGKQSLGSRTDHNAVPIERSFNSLRDGSATVQLQKAYLADTRRSEGPDVDRDGVKQRPVSRTDQNAFPTERSFTSLRDGSATVRLHAAYLEKMRRSGGPNHMVHKVFGRAGGTHETHPNRDGVKQSPVPITEKVAFPIERSLSCLRDGAGTVRLHTAYLAKKKRSSDGSNMAGDVPERMDGKRDGVVDLANTVHANPMTDASRLQPSCF